MSMNFVVVLASVSVLLASATPIPSSSANVAVEVQPCCRGTCHVAGEQKYYSIAEGITGIKHCGECCMDPKKYSLYHFFEKNLTKSNRPAPCRAFGFPVYDSTVTHGFGPVQMTLDLYNAPSDAVAKHTWKWDVTVDVFEGALAGFFDSSEFRDLKSCANDTVSAYDEIKAAIDNIEQKTGSSVEQGIKDLGAALTNLKDGLATCKAAEAEIESFVKVIEQFKSPAQFAYHVGKDLLVNGKDIYSEITTAVSDWKSESYRDAGIQIGLALNKLLVGETAVEAAPCCEGGCDVAGEQKYYSLAQGIFGTKHCGECCMDPKKYNLYHFFEKNLTKANRPSPCHAFGYSKYDSTVTHGFGPVKMTLDLYDLQ